MLSVIIPLIGVLYFLKDVIFPLNGLIFYGDVGVFTKFNLNDFTKACLYTWSGHASTGYLNIFPYFIYALLSQAFGFQMELRLQIILLAVLPATTMYFAVKNLAKEWFPKFVDRKWKEYFLPFVASTLYEFNYVNSNITDPLGAAGLQYAYIFLPLTFTLFIKYLYKGKLRDLLVLGVLSAFLAISPLWVVFFSFLVITYLVFSLILERYRLQLFVKRLLYSMIVLLSLNMFWILPTVAGYLQEATGPFQIYQPAKRLSYEGMKATYRLLDAIMFGHKTYNLFGIWPQNWNIANVVIPITVFLPLLVIKKSKHVIFLCSLALISTFMLKATNPPLEYFYYQLALHLPYGVGAVLTNYGTWAYIQAFSYFFLISLTLLTLISWNSRKKLLVLIVLLLQLVIFYSTLNGLLIDSQVYLPRFKPQDIPQIYYEINDWLSQQPEEVKVLWLPSGGVYVWKKYIITAFPDTMSARTPVRSQLVINTLMENRSITEALTCLGVKYVIYHGDSLDFPNEEILQGLLKQKDLKVVYKSNYTYIYENTSKKVVPFLIFENKEYRGPIYLGFPAENSSLNSLNTFNFSEKEIGTAHILSYRQISPVEWEVDVNASAPFLIVFTEPYDKLWRAYIGNEEVESIPFDIVNGFIIVKTGIIHIRIYYTLQAYYTLGLFISFVSFVLLAFLCIYKARNSFSTLPIP